jgi:hypothetical protein
MPKLEFAVPNRALPDDLSYFIDGAVEINDLPVDVAFWLRHLCPYVGSLLNQETNDPCTLEEHYVDTERRLIRVHNAYNKWFNNPKTDPIEKTVCMGVGLSSIRHLVVEAAKYIAETAIVEKNEDGGFPFNLRFSEPETKMVRRFKPTRITETGGHYEITVHDWKPLLEDGHIKRWLQLISEIMDRYRGFSEFPEEIEIFIPKEKTRYRQEYDRQQRKVIRRGIRLLDDLIGEDATRTFLATRTLDIPGEKFTLRVKVDHLKESHGGGTTQVLLKDQEICNLCIYTPETPILDHVASMITHVRAGLEDDLVAIGNPYGIKATEPTGVEVLDKRLGILGPVVGPEMVCDSIRPEVRNIIRLGDSPFTKTLQTRMRRRILGYLYETVLEQYQLPRLKVTWSFDYQVERVQGMLGALPQEASCLAGFTIDPSVVLAMRA